MLFNIININNNSIVFKNFTACHRTHIVNYQQHFQQKICCFSVSYSPKIIFVLQSFQIKVSTMNDIRSRWQQFAENHMEGQKLNPFSEEFDYDHAMSLRLHKGDSGYGRPKEGSKTAQRADRAQKHIYREMEEMCFIIRDVGQRDKDGLVYVTFGRLFDRYVKISDKVVGILLRCRKHKMVDFEGEMLWKGQDDDVIITLLV